MMVECCQDRPLFHCRLSWDVCSIDHRVGPMGNPHLTSISPIDIFVSAIVNSYVIVVISVIF
jgi:hypothetical protein